MPPLPTPRRSLVAALLAGGVVLLASPPAHAGGMLTLGADGTWIAGLPALSLGSTARDVTFNALQGAAVPQDGGRWFPGFVLDTSVRARDDADWFMPLFGIRFAWSDAQHELTLSDGVTVDVGNYYFAEFMLPGFGWRFGDLLSISARPFWLHLETGGGASDGHVSIGVGGGSDGFGLLGEASLCTSSHTGLCAYAQPSLMWLSIPDVSMTVGLRVQYDKR